MRARLALASAVIVAWSAFAIAGTSRHIWNFEQPAPSNNGGWFLTGGAGFDHGKGLANNGVGNAWVRNTTGWNAVNNWVNVSLGITGRQCTASAWIRRSANLTDGYMSVRSGDRKDGTGAILREIKLVGSGHQGYRRESFTFNKGTNKTVLFYVGLWGVGKDAWLQVDDAEISCPTPGK